MPGINPFADICIAALISRLASDIMKGSFPR